jgi:hypothetical protein
MKRLLLVAAALAALATPGNAAVFGTLGVNPTSATGNFSHDPTPGSFEDQLTFFLVGGPQFLTIASVTNTFAAPSDFIANFKVAVYTTGLDGIVNNADDVTVIAPVSASACPGVPDCQGMAGSATLAAGSYYVEFTGVAGATAGYAGNLSVAAVGAPGPLAGAGLPGLLAAAFGFFAWRRHRRVH